jgi:hypothetical protein
VSSPFGRRVVCAKAAAVLARQQQDTALVDEAIELVRGRFEFDHLSLTPDQARDVLQKEKAAPEPPGNDRPGPTYGDLLGEECQCARCRRARGEVIDPRDMFDDDLDADDFDADEDFEFGVPPDMPPEVEQMFADEVAKSIRSRESFQDFLARMLAGGSSGRRRKKGRRR